MNAWKRVWAKRSLPDYGKRPVHETMMLLDGCDSFNGGLTRQDFLGYVAAVKQRACIEEGDSIYEVGCGSGAFLYPFYEAGHKVGGLDYSPSLVEFCRRVMEGFDFRLGEAVELDEDDKYDFVVSSGVFHYFPDAFYASTVVAKMISKANKAVIITDVPDAAFKEDAERARRDALPPGEYERRYRSLKHLYFDKGLFCRVGSQYNCRVTIFNQNMNHYVHREYRFNCLLDRRSDTRVI